MQGSDRVLARRYAKALFMSAQEGKAKGDALRQQFGEAFKAVLPEMPALKSPTVLPAAKKELIRKKAGAASPTVLHFMQLLIDKKRIALLPAIASDLGRLIDEGAGRVRAHVRSASELAPKELETLTKKLQKFSGKDVAVDVKVDPSLIGGLVVRMEDYVLDGSLQGKLKQLATRLTEE